MTNGPLVFPAAPIYRDAPPPALLEETADGVLVLGDLRYQLVRRNRRRPEVALYERAS